MRRYQVIRRVYSKNTSRLAGRVSPAAEGAEMPERRVEPDNSKALDNGSKCSGEPRASRVRSPPGRRPSRSALQIVVDESSTGNCNLYVIAVCDPATPLLG